MKIKTLALPIAILALALTNIIQMQRVASAERRADRWEKQARELLAALENSSTALTNLTNATKR